MVRLGGRDFKRMGEPPEKSALSVRTTGLAAATMLLPCCTNASKWQTPWHCCNVNRLGDPWWCYWPNMVMTIFGQWHLPGSLAALFYFSSRDLDGYLFSSWTNLLYGDVLLSLCIQQILLSYTPRWPEVQYSEAQFFFIVAIDTESTLPVLIIRDNSLQFILKLDIICYMYHDL